MLSKVKWGFFFFALSAGGETIKQINQQTGAHCELDRRPPPNPAEKVFVIRGSPDQIEQAKRIISEKIGMVCITILFIKVYTFYPIQAF
jgi:hypothetical protein